MPENTKFLIVDDHPVIGIAMDLFLKNNFQNIEIERVEGGKDAISILKKQTFDLIILDVNLPDYNILSLIPNIFRIDAKAKILIFTMSPENILAKRLFSMNVAGFLSKGVSDDEILKAIRVILNGGKYISQQFSEMVLGDFLSGQKGSNPFEELSDREYEVMLEILKGKTTRDIGDKLNLHGSSVSTYRHRVFSKVGVSNNLELFQKAQLFGVVE